MKEGAGWIASDAEFQSHPGGYNIHEDSYGTARYADQIRSVGMVVVGVVNGIYHHISSSPIGVYGV